MSHSGESADGQTLAAGERQQMDVGGAKVVDRPAVRQVGLGQWRPNDSHPHNGWITSSYELYGRLWGIILEAGRIESVAKCWETNFCQNVVFSPFLFLASQPIASQRPISKPKKKKVVGLFRWAWQVGQWHTDHLGFNLSAFKRIATRISTQKKKFRNFIMFIFFRISNVFITYMWMDLFNKTFFVRKQ